MLGMILNVSDPDQTRDEVRHQEPIFTLEDGYPVFEAWYWHPELGRWFVMAKAYDPRMASAGVVYFSTVEELKQQIRMLGGVPRVA